MQKYFSIIAVVLVQIHTYYAARILAIVPIPSYSHQIPYRPIWNELSSRGHQITLLTTDPMNDPSLKNITEIDLSFTYHIYNNKHNISNIILLYNRSFFKSTKLYTDMMHEILDEELNLLQVQQLIKNESVKFDLVMVEYFFPVMYAFSERFRCPMIGLTPVDAQLFGHEALGNPIHPVIFPDVSQPFGTTLTFHERVLSTVYYVLLNIFKVFVVYPNGDRLVQKHFGLGYRKLLDIEKDVALVFMNTNSAFDDGRPLARKVIQIGGGIHITPTKNLSEDVQTFLDSADSGAIYFSLGSNVKCSSLGENVIRGLIQTFEELPYKVLWKCDTKFKVLHRKIKMENWLPQQDILRHQNIKLFITQGGYQSIEEAIANEVPIVGIPFFFDQHSNVKRMVNKGCAVFLDYESLTKKIFKKAILEIIQNPKYYENIRKLKTLIYDQPMTGLEKAVWWTEYVLRHGGTPHLKNPIVDCPFYKYFFLDVILFLCVIISMLVFFVYKLKNVLTFRAKEKKD